MRAGVPNRRRYWSKEKGRQRVTVTRDLPLTDREVDVVECARELNLTNHGVIYRAP